jgi:hypothetical protein
VLGKHDAATGNYYLEECAAQPPPLLETQGIQVHDSLRIILVGVHDAIDERVVRAADNEGD